MSTAATLPQFAIRRAPVDRFAKMACLIVNGKLRRFPEAGCVLAKCEMADGEVRWCNTATLWEIPFADGQKRLYWLGNNARKAVPYVPKHGEIVGERPGNFTEAMMAEMGLDTSGYADTAPIPRKRH